MRKVNSILCIILLFGLVACERQSVVDIDVPQKTKIFSAAFLGEGDASVWVHVSRSFPAIGYSDSLIEVAPPISDAIVFFHSPEETIQLNYDAVEQKYTGTLNVSPIMPDQSYRIKIIQQGETSEGSAVLPPQVKIATTLSVDSVFDTTFQAMKYKLRVSCTSLMDAQYISVQAKMIFEDSSTFVMTPNLQKSVFALNKNQVVEHEFTQAIQIFGLNPVRIEAQVYSISHDLYLYQNKLGIGDFYSLFPFSEPIFIHSNMSSGIGILGTYRLSHIGAVFLK